jgi:hypothetical protein
MNVRPRLLLFLGIILILSMVLSACVPAAQTPPPSEISGGTESGGETEGEAGTGGEEEPTEPADTGLAEDIPLPEGYYDESISSDGKQIVFKVAGTSEETVAFYQTKLEEMGWLMAGPTDTAVGSTALMLRTNENGDRLSINMQYNPNANFTVVTLVVTRAR